MNESQIRGAYQTFAIDTGDTKVAAQLTTALAIVEGFEDLIKEVRKLGLNDAATPLGAIEMLAGEVKNLADRISDSTAIP